MRLIHRKRSVRKKHLTICGFDQNTEPDNDGDMCNGGQSCNDLIE